MHQDSRNERKYNFNIGAGVEIQIKAAGKKNANNSFAKTYLRQQQKRRINKWIAISGK
jgi:hypothetical protein